MEIPQKVIDYVNGIRSSQAVTDLDEPLHLDSLNFIQLCAFLEKDVGLKMEDDELTLDNFDTLRTIGTFIATKSNLDYERRSAVG